MVMCFGVETTICLCYSVLRTIIYMFLAYYNGMSSCLKYHYGFSQPLYINCKNLQNKKSFKLINYNLTYCLWTGRCSIFIQPVEQQHALKQCLQLRPQRWEMVWGWFPFRGAEWSGAQWLSSGDLHWQRHWCHLLHCYPKQHSFFNWCLQGQRKNSVAGWASSEPESHRHVFSNTRLSCYYWRQWEPGDKPISLSSWQWFLQPEWCHLPLQVCCRSVRVSWVGSWGICALASMFH